MQWKKLGFISISCAGANFCTPGPGELWPQNRKKILRNKSFGTISTIFIGSFELKKLNENTFKSSNRIQTYLNEIRLFTSCNDNGSPKKLVIKGLQPHFFAYWLVIKIPCNMSNDNSKRNMGVSWDFWCREAFCTTGARWSWIGKKIFGYEWSLHQTNVTFQSTSTSTRKYRLDHVLDHVLDHILDHVLDHVLDHRTRLWFIVYEFPLIHIADFEIFFGRKSTLFFNLNTKRFSMFLRSFSYPTFGRRWSFA